MASQVTAGRFVGRTQQLARLGDLLTHATTGEPLLALVGGRRESARPAWSSSWPPPPTGRGVRVLRGGCVPRGEEGLPFAPVTEALRGLAAHRVVVDAVAGRRSSRTWTSFRLSGLRIRCSHGCAGAWRSSCSIATAWSRVAIGLRCRYSLGRRCFPYLRTYRDDR
jgi:hypothetical protein